jgi:hypothetical protein
MAMRSLASILRMMLLSLVAVAAAIVIIGILLVEAGVL